TACIEHLLWVRVKAGWTTSPSRNQGQSESPEARSRFRLGPRFRVTAVSRGRARRPRTTRRPGCDGGSIRRRSSKGSSREARLRMDRLLRGKVAVVTGAGRGIGLAITKALSDEGAHVVAGSRTIGGLANLDRVTPVAVDLSAPSGPAGLIDRAVADYGRV